jgi:hypothetical protein
MDFQMPLLIHLTMLSPQNMQATLHKIWIYMYNNSLMIVNPRNN